MYSLFFSDRARQNLCVRYLQNVCNVLKTFYREKGYDAFIKTRPQKCAAEKERKSTWEK